MLKRGQHEIYTWSTVKKCDLKKTKTENILADWLVFLHSVVSFYQKISFLYHSYYQTLLNLY